MSWLLHCSLPHNHYCCLLLSPMCMPHLFICTYLNSSPTACPPSSVLCKWLLCISFDICVFVTYVGQLKMSWDYLFMFAWSLSLVIFNFGILLVFPSFFSTLVYCFVHCAWIYYTVYLSIIILLPFRSFITGWSYRKKASK